MKVDEFDLEAATAWLLEGSTAIAVSKKVLTHGPAVRLPTDHSIALLIRPAERFVLRAVLVPEPMCVTEVTINWFLVPFDGASGFVLGNHGRVLPNDEISVSIRNVGKTGLTKLAVVGLVAQR